jgi:hypothetical protein
MTDAQRALDALDRLEAQQRDEAKRVAEPQPDTSPERVFADALQGVQSPWHTIDAFGSPKP